ncbi:MAG TPA: hypothetical protein VGC35_01355 [Allosphingosinicella sp.]
MVFGNIGASGGKAMRHYRLNKVTKPGGKVVKRRDTLASDDQRALEVARDDPDCPICEVWREGQKIGVIS